jgi:extracellular elastinolytic metalloproteinase
MIKGRYVLVLAAGLAAILLPAASAGVGAPKQLVIPNQGVAPLDVRDTAARARPAPTEAQLSLRASLGQSGVVDVDRVTGTPRVVAKLDGFLTGRSSAAGATIAMDYVRAHLAAFGLTQRDLSTLKLSKASYTDVGGTQHLYWEQVAQGIPAFDNGLEANVTKDGRLINVLGSPVPSLGVHSIAPGVDASRALRSALANAGSPAAPAVSQSASGSDPTRKTSFDGGHTASLVYFRGVNGVHLAWLVRAKASSTGDYNYVVDANSGQVLFRQNMVSFAGGMSWDYYPSTLLGPGVGTQTSRAWPAGWGPSGTTALSGNNAHVYKDVLDDNVPAAADDVPANVSTNWNYAFTAFNGGFPNNCDPRWQCSWDENSANTWQTNINQNATQVWYYVNTFHDWLTNSNIGFTEASGNFQVSNSSGQGLGGDAVQAQVDDGANTAGGLPDSNHQLNANMSTQQDGVPPRMQMYLFPGTGLNNTSPSANGGDDASVIYHEYTHGLSHRLVKLPNGLPALNSFQANAMGEAWSDWYAMDYLVSHGFDADTATVGDVQLGYFVGGGTTVPLRSEPMDCPNDASDHGGVCEGGNTPHFGGYSYGDLGHVTNGPEVHADGEIWGQTLWDLRQSGGIGSGTAEKIISDGMRLSPQDPSMLDMRNAIIQADTVDFAGAHRSTLWSVFANRGMGYFATTNGGNDTAPVADFTTETAALALPKGTLSGTITENGAPVAGVKVALGQSNGVLVGTTNASGNYSISNVPQHSYPIFVSKPYDVVSGATSASITGGSTTTANYVVRRDWASLYAGATLPAGGSSGPDYSGFGCGPAQAFDQSLGSGWSVDKPAPRFATIQLPQTITMSGYAIDPGATCGDDDNSSLGSFDLSVSSNGTTWTVIDPNRTMTAGNNHHLNNVNFGASGVANVRYVRITMKTTQGSTGTGASFIDMSELEVFATAGSTSAFNWTAQNSVDFDGNHVTDLAALYRGQNPDSLWYAPGTFQIVFGASTDIPVPGDYNGDGKTDAVIFRPSTGLWYGPATGLPQIVIQQVVGQAGDVPIPGDYDGDGKTDPAYYRPSTQLFFAVLSGGGVKQSTFGASGDVPVPRDYDGDGKTDFGIYRADANAQHLGLWYSPLSGGGVYQIFFGAPGDKPVPGDYDGDGKAEAVIFRSQANALWYGPKSGGGLFQLNLGTTGDVPIPGYYDSNQVEDPAVFHPANGNWFALLSGGGTAQTQVGVSTDIPVQKRPTLAGGL